MKFFTRNSALWKHEKGPVGPSTEYRGSALNRPSGEPAMPQALTPLNLKEPVRAHPVTALAASPWAPLIACAELKLLFAGKVTVTLAHQVAQRPDPSSSEPECGVLYS